jgi:hypothetical protein
VADTELSRDLAGRHPRAALEETAPRRDDDLLIRDFFWPAHVVWGIFLSRKKLKAAGLMSQS